MFIRNLENEYGTPIAEFKCQTCKEIFTICPRPEQKDHHQWDNCVSEHCDSYDPSMDADILFMTHEEIAEKKLVSIDMLRARRNGVSVVAIDT